MMENYISLTGLIDKLEIKDILVHTTVWETYLSHNFKMNIIRSLDILKALINEIRDTIPTSFTVDFGDGKKVRLVADYWLSDKCIMIYFEGRKYE